MRGNGMGSTRERRDGQGYGIARWIPDAEYGIDQGGLDQGQADNLTGARGAADHGVWQFGTIQRQVELSELAHAHLKQDLIRSDGPEVEGMV